MKRLNSIESTSRPCGPYPRHVPLDQLKAEVERHLQAGPRMLHVLARLLGYSEAAVRARLLELEGEMRVHRVPVPSDGPGGRRWEWRAGIAMDIDVDEEVGPGEIPRQASTASYPAIGRRDDLVVALFGPARMGAA